RRDLHCDDSGAASAARISTGMAVPHCGRDRAARGDAADGRTEAGMTALARGLAAPRNRPYLFLAGTVLLLIVLDWNGGRFLTSATAFSVLQTFATLGPAALGLGMTMLVREFDLSIAGVFGLAGCVAVLTGGESAWLGLVLGVMTGAAFGLVQGLIIT